MELTELRNIGAEMHKKLAAVGIHTAEELRRVGSKEAYARLKQAYPEVCAVYLYTLQGAIDGVDAGKLARSVKDELKSYSDSLK